MSGITLNEVNKIWVNAQAEQARIKSKGNTVTCPYPYYNYEPETQAKGLEKIQVQCSYGKGVWCKMCIHHKRHQAQERYNREQYKSMKGIRYRNYKEWGVAAHLRRLPSAEKVAAPSELMET